MNSISDRAKVLFLIILIIFISASGLLWMDTIGLIDISSGIRSLNPASGVLSGSSSDEPSLIERERFEKEKKLFQERVEKLDMREAKISELEKKLGAETEKLSEKKKGLTLEIKKFQDEKNVYSGYKKNVIQLAEKILSMPPENSVKIMIRWEDPLVIDVLRQMDLDAQAQGRTSITSYLITLMPEEKASRIMYLMTQL